MGSASIRISPTDWLAAHRLHARGNLRRRLVTSLAIYAVLLLGLVGYAAWSRADPHAIRVLVVTCLAWIVVFSVAQALFWVFGLPYVVRRDYRQRPNLQHVLTYSWSDTGIRAEAGTANSFLAWTDYVRWRESPDVYLLYPSPRQFQVFPKRMFASRDEDAAFRSLVQARLSL